MESDSDVEIKKREATTVRASYSDSNAFTHEREASLYESSLVIRDRAINSKENVFLSGD